MKHGLIFPLLLVYLLIPIAAVADFLYGEVTGVDQEQGEFLLVPTVARPPGKIQTGKELLIHVGRSTPPPPGLTEGEPFMPGCVQVGRHVRVWGRLSTEDASFQAADVRGCGGMGCNDPTGVRARLHAYRSGRCRGQAMENSPGTMGEPVPASEEQELDQSKRPERGTGMGRGRCNGGWGETR